MWMNKARTVAFQEKQPCRFDEKHQREMQKSNTDTHHTST